MFETTRLQRIPAAGAGSGGTATSSARYPRKWADAVKALAERCDKGGKVHAAIAVSGPHGMRLDRKGDLCKLRDKDGVPELRFTALNEGYYKVGVRVDDYRGSATFTIGPDGRTEDLDLSLSRWW